MRHGGNEISQGTSLVRQQDRGRFSVLSEEIAKICAKSENGAVLWCAGGRSCLVRGDPSAALPPQDDRCDRLGRSHTLPARLGAVHLPSREGLRRPGGGDGEGVPSPYKGRGDGIGCFLSLEMKTRIVPCLTLSDIARYVPDEI